jgi:hypothetical protein
MIPLPEFPHIALQQHPQTSRWRHAQIAGELSDRRHFKISL